MKKVILILQGAIGERFLEVLLEKYFSSNFYIVICKEHLVPVYSPSNFAFYSFDPTSRMRLSSVLDSSVNDIFVLVDLDSDKRAILENIEILNKDARVILESREDFSNFESVISVNPEDLLTNSLISKLPNVPLISSDIGNGEIMEINVPLGSVFAYRHLGSIRQDSYKIVGIYRQNKLLLADKSLVIHPRDALLVIGDPGVLGLLYRQVNSSLGQFPLPFGRDIYLYLDMKRQRNVDMARDIEQALFMLERLKGTRLCIIAINPRDFDFLRFLESKQNDRVSVEIDFLCCDYISRLKQDLAQKIGLLIIAPELFSKRKIRKALFSAQIPVMKTGKSSISSITKCVVALKEDMKHQENISSVIFDLALQMKLDISLFDFDVDGHFQEEIHQEYEMLSRMMNKRIEITKSSVQNPVLLLRDHKMPVLHCLPFERGIAGFRTFNFLSNSVELNSASLDFSPQIFVPIAK